LFINGKTASSYGVADDDWIWVESMHGRVRCMCRVSEAVEPGTVWTWNAIGKVQGAWHLAPDANEAQARFLLNHVIADELPAAGGRRMSNSDPVTGQAGWYDVRVRIRKAAADEPAETSPQFAPVPAAPGNSTVRKLWQAFVAGKGDYK
jgi:sulfite dehydrogenase (quinone) subunit SoeA